MPRLALLALVLIAFALRLYRLDAESLWYDEGVTAYVAQLDLVSLTRWTAADIQPPLYYYVVAAWGRIGGWGEWMLRAPSVFFGTLLVPLLATVAARLFHPRASIWLAALLATGHPFLIYYSQEARNYALLLVLGVAAGYCLLRAFRIYLLESGPQAAWREDDPIRDRRLWLVYILLATAALYTHYFAAFLIAAFVLIALLNASRRHLVALSASHLIIFLFFTPWLFVMLRQLGGDASYLPGPFRWDNALADLATGALYGETYVWWPLGVTWPLALITLPALVGLLRRQASTLRVTLLWIIVPTAGVLALAGVVPKFNVRYASLALPGLILLWAGGLAHLPEVKVKRAGRAYRSTFYLSRIVQLTAFALLATCFLHANRLWASPTFITRSQWREVATHIRQHHQPGDAVVLSSGHVWPVWQYYAPDIDALRLPDIDVLNVDEALCYREAGELLREGLEDSERVWLVRWQDDVLDPMNAVPLHLSQAGRQAALDASFWHIDLARFENVEAAAIDPTPPRNLNVRLADAELGEQLLLLGSERFDEELLLFWQLAPGVDSLDANYELAGEITVDRDGARVRYSGVSDRRLTEYDFPTSRWQPDQIAVSRMPLLADMNGALPGDYTMRLVVYAPSGDPAGLDVLDEAGNPRGKQIAVPIHLEMPLLSEGDESTPADTALSAAVIGQHGEREAEPGQSTRLEVWWKVHEPIDGTPQFALRWLRDGEIVVEEAAQIDGANGVWGQLAPGDSFREVRLLRPPLALPPGEYDAGFFRVDNMSSDPAWQIPFNVLPSTRTFDLPPLAQSIDATFSDTIELVGPSEPLPDQLAPAGELSTTLVWRALDAPAADYSVTLQLLDETGRPAAQSDVPLPSGSRNWLANEVVTQTLELVAPEEAGTYRVIAAVYDTNSVDFARLRTSDGADLVELGIVEVAGDTSN